MNSNEQQPLLECWIVDGRKKQRKEEERKYQFQARAARWEIDILLLLLLLIVLLLMMINKSVRVAEWCWWIALMNIKWARCGNLANIVTQWSPTTACKSNDWPNRSGSNNDQLSPSSLPPQKATTWMGVEAKNCLLAATWCLSLAGKSIWLRLSLFEVVDKRNANATSNGGRQQQQQQQLALTAVKLHQIRLRNDYNKHQSVESISFARVRLWPTLIAARCDINKSGSASQPPVELRFAIVSYTNTVWPTSRLTEWLTETRWRRKPVESIKRTRLEVDAKTFPSISIMVFRWVARIWPETKLNTPFN